MAYARYYVHRNGQISTNYNTLVINVTVWTWAAVRGRMKDSTTQITPIPFVDGTNCVLLTATLTSGDTSLEDSLYEIVFGDASNSPTTPAIAAECRPIVTGANISFVGNAGWVMDRDPPPPPMAWAFGPQVNL
jgi:hypothetical protein